MNAETLSQLLKKTDFYRPLGQISEELSLDYEQILEGLADLADRGIILNLGYLKENKQDMLLLSDDQFGKLMSIYSKSKRNKVKNKNETPCVLSPRIQYEAKMEEAVCSKSCQGMSLMEMERNFNLTRQEVFQYLEKGVADKMTLQVNHLITELESELERVKNIRRLSQTESTDESLVWNLYIEWIDSKGEFHKNSLNYPLPLLCSTLDVSYHPDMSEAELKAEIFLKLRSERCKKVQHIGITAPDAGQH